MLDLTSLDNALARLWDSLDRCRNPAYAADPALERQLRGGAIQAFECTYEAAVKTLRRQLEAMDSTEVDHLPFRAMIRLAAERGLVRDPQAWFEFRRKRDITVHTCDEEKAALVYGVLESFAGEAQVVLAEVEGRNPCT